MENITKENNNKTTTTINDSVNETIKRFQITIIKTVEEIIVKKMSIINLDIMKTIRTTLEVQQLPQQRVTQEN